MSEPSPAAEPAPDGGALSVRSLLLAIVFLVIGALWIRKASLIAFTILVGEGTPPVPALTALALMTALGMVVGRLAVTRRWRREALLVYVLLTCGFITIDANGIRQLLATITSLRYFAASGNDYAALAQTIPTWLMPDSDELLRGFYEGIEGSPIPWGQWLPILVVWGGMFLVLSLSLGCLVSLFRKPWAEQEHLTFPLAELALQLAPDPPDRPGQAQLLRSWLFWIGVGIAAIYDGSNIAHAFSPGIAAIGQNYDLSPLLSERPWTGLRPINLTFRPEIVGLGYLVPTDVLLSVWVFYLLLRVENFGAELFGGGGRGFPHDRPQGIGAYFALAIFTIYTAREHLRGVVRAAVGDRSAVEGGEAIPTALAFWGVIAGIVGLTAFMVVAGMAWGTALSYVLIIYICSLVYARIRAQTGLPITYGVPREEMFDTILAVQPTPDGLTSPAAIRAESVFAVFRVIGRMIFGQIGAFEMEGIRIARQSHIRRSHLMTAVVIGLIGGLVLAYVIHIVDAYNYGWNIIDGGSTQGGYRTAQALLQYARAETRIDPGEPLKLNTTIARGVGFGLSLLMLWLRSRFLRFPLNPVGLALAGTFGSPIWFPIFLAWLAKSLILRLGGAHSYRHLTPVFLGIAIGHFLIAGGIWGIVGAFNEEVARRYLLWFA